MCMGCRMYIDVPQGEYLCRYCTGLQYQPLGVKPLRLMCWTACALHSLVLAEADSCFTVYHSDITVWYVDVRSLLLNTPSSFPFLFYSCTYLLIFIFLLLQIQTVSTTRWVGQLRPYCLGVRSSADLR